MVRLFFLSFFALWNFEFPAKIKKGGGEDPPDPLTREATMAKRMMIVMIGVVRFMVVWLGI